MFEGGPSKEDVGDEAESREGLGNGEDAVRGQYRSGRPRRHIRKEREDQAQGKSRSKRPRTAVSMLLKI